MNQQSQARDAQDPGMQTSDGLLSYTVGRVNKPSSALPTGGQLLKGRADRDAKQEESGETGKGGNR